MTKRLITFTAMIATLLIAMAGAFGSSAAQDSATPAMGMAGHPAHIHTGTCETIGGVVFPLNDVTSADAAATPAMGMDMASTPAMGMDMASTPDMGMNMASTPDMGMDMASTPDMGMDMASTPGAGSGLQSTTTVDASLDDIIAGGHAINVHQSAENIDVYVACGDVTGEATDGMLTVELQELNDSMMSGEAMLTDNGDGTTTVEIHLMQGESDMATPAA